MITLLTPYTGTGAIPNEYRPLISDLWTMAWRDVTQQPCNTIIGAVNLLEIEADPTPAQLAAIQADSRFEVLYEEA